MTTALFFDCFFHSKAQAVFPPLSHAFSFERFVQKRADLSVGALCAHFNISRSGLYQIAKTYFGKGIEQLTRELRIAKAKSILLTADYPVSEVAAMVGYNDYNYFIKVFKKETGVTPKRYSLQRGRVAPSSVSPAQ